MSRRLDLQLELEELLGSRNVYFQPPTSIKLKYPCIIYSLDSSYNTFANDKRYFNKKKYDVIFITNNADSDFADKIIEHFFYCAESRRYTAENLYHMAFILYY